MSCRPTLFLIDGSSQMYRAYHAFRGKGLSNQEGQTTHAVYVFVTMLRKLIARSQARLHRASFDLAGPTFRDKIVTDYKANRVAMPDDLAEQINWVHEACEALGVPILTAPGYEADDVIGTVAQRGRGAGSRSRSSRSTRISFSSCATASACTTRARTAPGSTRAASSRSSASSRRRSPTCSRWSATRATTSPASPGIGKKGAIDLITTHGSLDALLDHAADLQAEVARGADRAPRRTRCEPRAGHDPPRRAAGRRLRVAAVPRRVARALLRAVLAAGVPRCVNEYAPTRDRHDPRRTTRSSRRWPSSTR